MKDFSDVFGYFENKLRALKDEYGLNSYSYNPCSFRKKEDLKSFVTRLARDVFEEDDLEFYEAGSSQSRVDFIYLGHKLFLEIDEKFGHVELDFYETVEFMAFLSEKMIATVNPTGVSIGGEAEEMREAWSKGLPIHIPDVKFLHKHMTGKFYKKEEIGSALIVEGCVQIEDYEENVLVSLNDFLEKEKYQIRYNSTQVICYQDHKNRFAISISGDYAGGFSLDIAEGRTIFNNGVLNQIFLSDYLERHPNLSFSYQMKNDKPQVIAEPFQHFIQKLGKQK